MVVRLSTAEATATVDPHGARLASYRSLVAGHARDWLLPALGPTSSFVMVPFCSRIRGGQFGFRGREVQLPANNPPEPHAIHGHGWLCPWQVVRQSTASVLLRYEHPGGAWPWAYRADLEISLQRAELTMQLAVTNRADSAMPVGLGFHLYFSATPDVVLRAQTSHRWVLDEQLMPVARRPLRANDPQLADGLALAAHSWDAVFAGWDQRFEIHWPEWGAQLTGKAAGPLGDFVVYAPHNSPWFCAEPVSNVPDAFNLHSDGEAHSGTIVLEPDAVLTGRVLLSPHAS